MDFKEWLLISEMVRRPNPVKLHFPNGEFLPPVDLNSGYEYKGPGLICFDFDQTLTKAVWYKGGSHSTAVQNPAMLVKMEQHKDAGNQVQIVTARGTKENSLRKDAGHPLGLQPTVQYDPEGRLQGWDYKIAKDPAWGAIPRTMKPTDVSLTGGVMQAGSTPKGPHIASLMAKHGHEWAILYDDNPGNVKSADKMQDIGIAVKGMLVDQIFEPGPEGLPPARANTHLVGASGL
jgi:hypothetical protein